MKRAIDGLLAFLVLGWQAVATTQAAEPKPAAKPQAASKAESKAPTDAKAEAKPNKAGLDFFEAKIRPVLVGKCYQCHSTEAKEVKGGLLLDTRAGTRKGGESGPAVVPRDPDGSLLVEALRHEGLEMPPKEQLPEAVIADFVRWIDMGAPDPREGKAAVVRKKIDIEEAKKFWAYQPVKQPTPPAVKDAAWPHSDFDRYLLAALEAKGLKPSADADRATLLRRVTLDLVGLLPTSAEIDAFVNDQSPEAFAKVVDRLLASPQFGERWGRHWLDVARYGESTGKERNVPYPVAWKYRDYVIDSFNADKPYDRFVTEQVAGDLLPAKTPEERNTNVIATGFLALGPKGVNERDNELYLLDIADEQIDVTCRAVLATTASCARCHDHKFDPIPQTDYYALAGIFYKGTDTRAGIVRRERGYNTKELLALETTGSQPKPATKSDDQPSASDVVTKTDKKKLQERLEEARAELRKMFANKAKAKADKNLREKAKNLNAEVRRLEAQLAEAQATSETKAKAKPANKKNRYEVEEVKADELATLAIGVREGRDVANCQVRLRGEPADRGDEIPRGFLSVLKTASTPKIDPKHSGRLELAQWLTGRDNPLTARVLANRLWFHLFGAGLVESVDNFGALGETPSHPELLDALATYVMDHNWSIKQTIRAIVLSRAYQMSSAHDDAGYAVDPGNRLVWRMNRRRLDAEVIHDTALQASGRLDLSRPYGSPVMKGNGEIGRTIRESALRAPSNHRGVYLPAVRGVTPEMLAVFDVADSSLVVGQREVTTVATQALYMLNSPFALEQADATAQRLLDDPTASDAALADRAYRLLLARPATEGEVSRAVSFVRDYQQSSDADQAKKALSAWAAFCQVLFSSAEFRYAY